MGALLMDDRSALIARIQHAASEGRISAVDRDLRIQNVRSAGSPTELELMSRDLDLLEATLQPGSAALPPATPGPPSPVLRGSRRRTWMLVLIVHGVLLVVGVTAALVFTSGSDRTPSPSVEGIVAQHPEEVPDLTSPSNPQTPRTAAYSLSADGVRTFIATYRDRFGTTRTVSATFYGDYVVVQVPVAGTKRHSGWVYRPASGFTDFGGVTANFPGSTSVDLARLDVAAMMRNLARAKRLLHVAASNQAYVTIDYRPQFDPAPNVNIYLANKYNESGYLATRLNGAVERAYPFGQ